MRKVFVLYDGRAKRGCTDKACVIDVRSLERSACNASRALWEGFDAVWFEYEERGGELINEMMRYDIGREYLL